MKKKLFSLLMALLLLFSLTSTAYASDDAEKAPDVTTEDFAYFIFTTNYLGISSGTASCEITAYCVASVDRIDLSMYLQKYDGGWVTIANWSSRTNSNYASLARQYSVVSGYAYRLRGFYYAYIDGFCVETNIMNYYTSY